MDARAGQRGWTRGFTLIELVLVLVLVSALAVFAAPRLAGISGFSARGFHDETLALLRHAHKSAIAQRRPVCVRFTSSSASLAVDADRDSATGANGCEADLAGADGRSPGGISARGAVRYASAPPTLVFDAQGRPSAGLLAQVDGAARQIVVEAVTGYVHD